MWCEWKTTYVGWVYNNIGLDLFIHFYSIFYCFYCLSAEMCETSKSVEFNSGTSIFNAILMFMLTEKPKQR